MMMMMMMMVMRMRRRKSRVGDLYLLLSNNATAMLF
jgi:hypothetical protein